ncbi:MAG: hypothetical protein PVG14_18355 [Anaerolineales bacterium]
MGHRFLVSPLIFSPVPGPHHSFYHILPPAGIELGEARRFQSLSHVSRAGHDIAVGMPFERSEGPY